MPKNNPVDSLSQIVAILTPLTSEERVRVMLAAMALLGETQASFPPVKEAAAEVETHDGHHPLPPRARTWMKQNSVTIDDLEQVFHMTGDKADVIASHMPGRDKKEQTYNAYILTGIGRLLTTGTPSFEDTPARELCKTSGCFDASNHSTTIKKHGNEFTGTKNGWTLTTPGLKRGADIVKGLNKPNA